MKAEERVKRLLSVTTKLSDLVKQENELLAQDKRARDLADIVNEKQSLSTVYEQHIQSINEDASMSEVDSALRQRLKDAIAGFNQLLAENKIRLEAKIHASKHLFQVISDCARDRLNETGAYGENGTRENAAARQAYRPPVSVGLNQEL